MLSRWGDKCIWFDALDHNEIGCNQNKSRSARNSSVVGETESRSWPFWAPAPAHRDRIQDVTVHRRPAPLAHVWHVACLLHTKALAASLPGKKEGAPMPRSSPTNGAALAPSPDEFLELTQRIRAYLLYSQGRSARRFLNTNTTSTPAGLQDNPQSEGRPAHLRPTADGSAGSRVQTVTLNDG